MWPEIAICVALLLLIMYNIKREMLEFNEGAGDISIDKSKPHVGTKQTYEFNAWPPPGYNEMVNRSSYNWWERNP